MALSRRARSTRLLVMSLVTASLITITVDYRGGESGPLEVAGRGVLSVVGPLQDAVTRVFRPVASFLSGLLQVGSLQEQNQVLKERVEELEQLSGEAVGLQREVERYRELLGLEKDLGIEGVPALVIGESPSNFEWSITINRGTADGVQKDMPVVTGKGLVGHVVEAAGNWSTVQLIIDPRSSVAARLGSSGEIGLVEGQRNNPMTMDLVNPAAKVVPNELVETSGYQGGLYPPGIPVGFVASVYPRPGSLTQSILVRPAVDFSSLEVVEVVRRSRPPVEPTPSPGTEPSAGATPIPTPT